MKDNSDNFVSGLVSTAIADNPYFKLMQYGDFKPSKEGISMMGKERTGCHICGETHVTLYKDGKKDGKTIYICKDCKMVQALNEEDEDDD